MAICPKKTPETISAPTSYLKKVLVPTNEEHPLEIISMVTDAITTDRTEEADGYILELGHMVSRQLSSVMMCKSKSSRNDATSAKNNVFI